MSVPRAPAAVLVLSLSDQCALSDSNSDSTRPATVTCIVCHCHLSVATGVTACSDRDIPPVDGVSDGHLISTLPPELAHTLAGVCSGLSVSNSTDRWLCKQCLRRLTDLAECEDRAARLRVDLQTNGQSGGDCVLLVAATDGAAVETTSSSGDSSVLCYEVTPNRLALLPSSNNAIVLSTTVAATTVATTTPAVLSTSPNNSQTSNLSPTQAVSLVYLRDQTSYKTTPGTDSIATTAVDISGAPPGNSRDKNTGSSAAILRQMWRRVYINGDNNDVDTPPPHRQPPLFECLVCGRHFVHRKSVNVHVRTHTGERPFACAECGRRFALRSTLAQHRLTHTGRRSFACAQCGRTFVARSNLRHHQRVHTDQKRACCDQCGKTFRDVQYLRIHMRVHTGERPYRCAVCERSFTTLSNLYKHERQRHSTTAPPAIVSEIAGKGVDGGATYRPILQPSPVVVTHQPANRPSINNSGGSTGGNGGESTTRSPFACGECSVTFTRRETLRRHMRRFHPAAVTSQTHTSPIVSVDMARLEPSPTSVYSVSKMLPQSTQQQQQKQRHCQSYLPSTVQPCVTCTTTTTDSVVDDLSAASYCQLSELLPLSGVDTAPYLDAVFSDLGSEGASVPPSVESPLLVNDILSQSHPPLSSYDPIVQ